MHRSSKAAENLKAADELVIKTKGSFPSQDAARKLVYLALQNAGPARTRTRN